MWNSPKSRHKRDDSAKSSQELVLRTEKRLALAGKLEWVLCAAVCLLAVFLQAVLYQHAGPFWRDEVGTIQISTQPTIGDMWSALCIESFPPLFDILLRLWTQWGPGNSQASIRMFGAIVAIGGVASVVFSAWMLIGRAPLLAVALVSMNVAVFYFSSSIRAYGLAMLLILPCLAVFWRVVRSPNRWNVSGAMLLSLLSVYSNYQNCCILFGIGIAGAVACLQCRLWKRATLILTICFIAALSLVVYIPLIFAYRETSSMIAGNFAWRASAATFANSLSGGNAILLLPWIAVLIGMMVSLVVQSFRAGREDSPGVPSLPLYCLVVAVVANVAGVIFFAINGLFLFSWHIVPFIALAGVLAEVGLQSTRKPVLAFGIRILAAGAVVAFSVPLLWQHAHLRRSNLDVLCKCLENEARADDLIIVTPIWLTYGFDYHYRGKTPWQTLPAIPQDPKSTLSPFVAYKKAMATSQAILPTLQRIAQTLSAGNKIWIVGGISLLPPNARPPDQPPAPSLKYGWNYNTYNEIFSMQLGHFLQTRGVQGMYVPISAESPVVSLENMPLLVVGDKLDKTYGSADRQ